MVIIVDSTILTDIDWNKFKAEILFTHFDYTFGKNYIIYLVDKDLLASSYEKVEDKYIINNDLSSREYDMLDREIIIKLGDNYA